MLTEGDILQMIADCEAKLWRLKKDIAAFNGRRSSMISHHIQCAKQIANECLDMVADGD